ncbi:hypothetical protein GQ607_012959 [Colletotrichum asianum]|uniref:Uncharacterized protein n=1 Tax=Colletotrichum asianum TaxID=702518 RepID=A0A8H3W5W4_9PEZI|nr:hypothetical protein GQ607_012959 [Colletotrichum asianum]
MFPERSRFAIPDIRDNVTGNRFLVSYRCEPPPPEYRHLRPGRANSHLVSFGSAPSQESRRVPGEIPPVWSRLVGSLITYCFVVGELWGLWSQSKAKKTTSATPASSTSFHLARLERQGNKVAPGFTGQHRAWITSDLGFCPPLQPREPSPPPSVQHRHYSYRCNHHHAGPLPPPVQKCSIVQFALSTPLSIMAVSPGLPDGPRLACPPAEPPNGATGNLLQVDLNFPGAGVCKGNKTQLAKCHRKPPWKSNENSLCYT